jgi:hypothetical protein
MCTDWGTTCSFVYIPVYKDIIWQVSLKTTRRLH